MSPETLQLCLGLLSQVTLSGGDPDLADKTAQVVKARAELTEALAAPPTDDDPTSS